MTDADPYEGYLADESGELPKRGVWRAAETYLCEKYNLEIEHGPYYDALDVDNEPVELKSCQAQYRNGEFGKFKFWVSQLIDLEFYGKIAVLVYAPEERYPVVATRRLQVRSLPNYDAKFVKHPTMGDRHTGSALLEEYPWPSLIPESYLCQPLANRYYNAHWADALLDSDEKQEYETHRPDIEG